MDKNENDPAMPPPSYPDRPKEDMTLHLLPGEPIQSRKRYTANQMIAYGIHCADVALAASQQPAEQAQGQAAEHVDMAGFIALAQRSTQQGVGELPLPNWDKCVDMALLEDYRQRALKAEAALAQRAGSAKPSEQAEAQGKPSQPAGAIQEIIRQAKSPEEHGWQDVTEDQFIKASINGYEVRIVYLAPPAAVQSTQELRDALTELATVQQKLIDANAEITALNLAASANHSDTGCQSINPPEFPKYPAGIADAMSHEHLWDYACLTGWRTGNFLQSDSERDAVRYRMMKENDFTSEYSDYIKDCLNGREHVDLDAIVDAMAAAAPQTKEG